MNDIFLTTAYLAPIQYYSKLYHAKRCIIEKFDHYTKQTFRNRCIIAGANGLLSLSIPTVKPNTIKAPSCDIKISDHGNWQHQHWNAIEAAYNSSPFFEYYIDDFYPFYHKKFTFLFDFNESLRELICNLLEIDPYVLYTSKYEKSVPIPCDFRDFIHPKKACTQEDPFFVVTKYYQVFEHKLGFLPNLSIIDLLFNMGPESRLILQKSYKDQ